MDIVLYALLMPSMWSCLSTFFLQVGNFAIDKSIITVGDLNTHLSNPGLGRCPGGGHGNPLQYSCLKKPWTEEPGGLQSIESQRVGHNWSDIPCMRTCTHTHTQSMFSIELN